MSRIPSLPSPVASAPLWTPAAWGSMSRIPSLPSPVAERDRIRDRAAAMAQRAGFFEAVGAALMETTPAVWAREFLTSGFEPDPAWKLDQKTLDELGHGLSPDLRERLGGAVSFDHAIAISVQAQKQQARREALASRGWQGTALSVIANITDPVYAGTALLTGGLGEIAAAGRAGRIAAMIRSGLIAGVPFAAIEATKHLDDPNDGALDVLSAGLSGFGFGAGSALTRGAGRGVRFLGAGAGQAAGGLTADAVAAAAGSDKTADDVLWNAAGAFIMGGTFNALHASKPGEPLAPPDPVDAAARRMQRDVEYREAQAARLRLTAKGAAYFKEQVDPGGRVASVVAAVVEELKADGLQPETIIAAAVRANDGRVFEADTHAEAAMAAEAEGATQGDLAGIERADLFRTSTGRLVDLAEAKTLGMTEPRGHTEQTRQAAVDAAVAKDFAPKQGKILYAMGAATLNPDENPNPPPKKANEFGDLDLSNANAAAASMGGLRFDMPGMVSQSGVESFRLAANVLGPDPLPKTDGSPSVYTAPEWVYDGHAADQAKMFTANDALYGEYAKAQKAAGKKPLSREAWAEEVGKATRRESGAYTSDPTVNTAADNLRKMLAYLYGIATRHGVKGFDKFDARDTYFSRIGARDKVDAAIAAHGEEAVQLLVARAISAGSEGIGADKANLLAKVWLRNIGKVYDGSDVSRGRIFAEDQSSVLAAALREAVPGITEEQVEDVLFAVKPREGESGTISRARRRIGMDETFSQETGNGARLGIEDLLENNAEVIGSLYSRQIRGAAAMAEVFRVMKRSKDEVIDTLAQLMKRLEEDARAYGHTTSRGELLPKIKSDLSKIETMAKIAAGIPLRETTQTSRVMRIIRNMNYFRDMPGIGTGMQNASELIYSMSEGGLKATINSIPGLGRVFARAKDGQLETPFLRECEAWIGSLGTERINRRSLPHLGRDEGSQVGLSRAEEISAKFARVAGDLSLVAPGQTALQRITATIIGNRWAEIAWSGRLPSDNPPINPPINPPMLGPGSTITTEIHGPGGSRQRRIMLGPGSTITTGIPVEGVVAHREPMLGPGSTITTETGRSGRMPSDKRLAGMGLTRAMAERIAGQIRKHGETEKGLIGVKMVRFNMDRWDDIEAASHFRIAVSKQARRLIMVNNQAAYAKWMTSETGKIISQLRTFAFGAWTNKFLYEVKMRDAQAFTNVATTTVAAGLVYVGRTYLESVGHTDRKKFLADRLSMAKIAEASFSRAAWSSMIPTAVDTLVSDVGQRSPVFSFARTTGLEGGALFGNPTFDWASKAVHAVGSFQAPLFGDYDFSKQDVRNFRDGAWVPNVLGLRNIIDQLSYRLPDKSQGQ